MVLEGTFHYAFFRSKLTKLRLEVSSNSTLASAAIGARPAIEYIWILFDD
jgi:hypothetical protein